MPLKFWDEAFLTATFLINLLPTKVLNLVSPVEKLLNITQTMMPLAPLAVPVGQTFALIINASSPFAQNAVSFLDTVLFIKELNV
jgi:ligand-binding SRPBCC domain-containing protein